MSDNTNTGRRNGGNGGHRNRTSRTERVTYIDHIPVTTDYIGSVVGKGGATVNKIKSETGARISLMDPRPGQGHLVHSFAVSANNRNSVDHAKRWILRIIANTYRQDHPDEFQDDTEGNHNETDNA